MGLCESCCGRGLKYEALDSNHKRSTPGSGDSQQQQANAARENAVAKPASQLIARGNGSAKAQTASVLPADAAATATGNRAGTAASAAAAATVAGGSKPSVLAAAAAGGAARASVKGYGTAQAGYQPNGAATTSTAPAMRSAGPRAHYGYQQPQAAYQQQNYQYRPGARPAGSAYSAMATGYAGGRAAPSGAGVAASTFMRSAQPGAGGRGMPGHDSVATVLGWRLQYAVDLM
ncbi:hypothetical protein JKP88DRAFT_319310 [Tribonema minus]|uniref:Uncharacterized protein n=1 Tax=Tribonema minus TaxID=303371 RepID=A0A835YY38_9STRA|nr:hypothetical protein JKP88DRAFT_319310 [Tribonema minus]